MLAVHEAVANGFEHGMSGTPVVVGGRVDDGVVIVEITTAGSWEASGEGGLSDELRGRGLQLMRGLTNGVEIVPDGEFVTVRLRSVSQRVRLRGRTVELLDGLDRLGSRLRAWQRPVELG